MSAQHQSWISLNSVIYDYISEAELNQSKYVKLFHLAYRCFESLGLSFFYQIKSVQLPKNANNTVTLPPDFLKYTKIGVLNGGGQLVPLKYNENLTTLDDLRSDRISTVGTSNFLNYYSFSSPIFFNYWDGYGYFNLYGISGAYSYGGSFKIDSFNGVIILDSSFGWPGLVIEYTATPIDGEDYFLPVEFREAIIAWLAYMDIRSIPSSRKGNLGDKRDRRHEYFEARRLAIRDYRPFYLDQAYIANVQSQRLCVKV